MMISEKGHLYDSKDINSVSRFHSTERKNCLSLMGQFASIIFLQGNSARKLKCFGKLSGKEVFCTESTRYASLSQQWKLKINKGPHTQNEHIIIWTLSRTGTQPSHWCIKPRECTCVPIHWFPFKADYQNPLCFWREEPGVPYGLVDLRHPCTNLRSWATLQVSKQSLFLKSTGRHGWSIPQIRAGRFMKIRG